MKNEPSAMSSEEFVPEIDHAQKDIEYKPTIEEVVKSLDNLGILYQKPTPYQIKVRNINYYPSSGKITIDGDNGPSKRRGFSEFKKLALRRI